MDFDTLKREHDRQKGRTDISILSPSQLGEIIWLHKSGWSTEAIANKMNVKTWNIDHYIKSVKHIAT